MAPLHWAMATNNQKPWLNVRKWVTSASQYPESCSSLATTDTLTPPPSTERRHSHSWSYYSLGLNHTKISKRFKHCICNDLKLTELFMFHKRGSNCEKRTRTWPTSWNYVAHIHVFTRVWHIFLYFIYIYMIYNFYNIYILSPAHQ